MQGIMLWTEWTGGGCVAFIDNDDFVDPEMYVDLIGKLQETGASFACCNFRAVDEKGRAVPDRKEEPREESVLSKAEVWHELGVGGTKTRFGLTTYLWDKVFRKELLDGLKLRTGSNWDDAFAVHEIIEKSQSVFATNRCYYNYFVRSDSTSHSFNGLRDMDIVEDRCVRARFLLRYGYGKDAGTTLCSAVRHFAGIYKRLDRKDEKVKVRAAELLKMIKDTRAMIPRKFIAFKHKAAMKIFFLSPLLFASVRSMVSKI